MSSSKGYPRSIQELISRVQVFSLLKCRRCGEEIERSFKKGEYVGKLTEEKCPKCGDKMFVKYIYMRKPRKR